MNKKRSWLEYLVETYDEQAGILLLFVNLALVFVPVHFVFGQHSIIDEFQLPIVLLIAIATGIEFDWLCYWLWGHEIVLMPKFMKWGLALVLVVALFFSVSEFIDKRRAAEFAKRAAAERARIQAVEESESFKRGIEFMKNRQRPSDQPDTSKTDR